MHRAGGLAAVLAAMLATFPPASGDTYTVHHGQTALWLDEALLGSAGLTVRVFTDEERDGLAGANLTLLPFSEIDAIALMPAIGLVSGVVQHRELLAFETRDGRIVVEDLSVDLNGDALAGGVQLVPTAVAIENDAASIRLAFDVRLTCDFAKSLSAPELTPDISIGSGAATLFLSHQADDGGAPSGPRGGCTPSTGPDVIIGDLPAIANYTTTGDIDAFSVGTTSCNIGSENLLWVSSNANHPVIPQNMYRLKVVDGAARFEQVGMSWMKHGFTALTQNLCCTCNGQGGGVLGVGCSDPYSAPRNGEQITTVGGLGPRFQVNPHSGAFLFPYMFRNMAHVPHTSVTRRLQVHLDDLDPALNGGALYYIEAQYITPDDAAAGNQDNNASYRRINITGARPSFRADVASTVVRERSAIRAWKAIDAGVTETTISTPEADNGGGDITGVAILSAKATAIAGGMTHYEYALYNMNSDRGFSAFEVPVGPGVMVTNIGFHDVAYHSGDGFGSSPADVHDFDGTDWPGAYDGQSVRWEMRPATPIENSNALRWATLYNFRFDANVAATAGEATLGMFKPAAGRPDSIQAATVAPMHSDACGGDVNADGQVDLVDLATLLTRFGQAGGATDGDLDGDGVIGLNDLSILLANFGRTCA